MTLQQEVLQPTAVERTAPPELQRRNSRRRQLQRMGIGAAGVAVTLLVWEISALVLNDPISLPTVSATAHAFSTYLGTRYPANGNTIWQDALISTRRILLGFVFGTALGAFIGAVMAGNRTIRHLLDPLIELTRPLPPLAFIPLFVVWFGINETPKIVLIMVGVVPTVVIATVSALDAVPQELVQASRALGAGPVHTMVHVRLRSAVPGIITGMRLAMGGAWTSIVAVEMIAATSGVGFLILQSGNYLQTPLIFSGIITISILGIALDGLLRLVHRLADPTTR